VTDSVFPGRHTLLGERQAGLSEVTPDQQKGKAYPQNAHSPTKEPTGDGIKAAASGTGAKKIIRRGCSKVKQINGRAGEKI